MKTSFYLVGVFVILIVAALLFWKLRSPKVVTEEQGTAPTSTPVVTERKTYTAPPTVLPDAERNGKKIRIVTAKGEIVLELFGDEAPKTVSNFLTLAKDGFYNGLTFHRREEGFVIQGGDPNGNGTGDPGYKFEDEPVQRPYARGVVAMANSGSNTNGSQFFIMLADYPLPPSYTIFGKVISGQDVVSRIQVGDVMERVTVE